MIKTLALSLIAIAVLSVSAFGGLSRDSQVVGSWKFKTMDFGPEGASPMAQSALKRVQKENPTITLTANHRFVMKFGPINEGSWKMSNATTLVFTLSKIGTQSVAQMRKKFRESLAKDPASAKAMANTDPFGPLTATLGDHGTTLTFKAKQKNGERMVFSKAR